VPLMTEIADIPWNGYNAISTFSGCGGSSLGYKMAGFKVLWANEFIPAAQDTYRANHPGTILDTRDIRQVSGDDILNAIGLQRGQLDLFDGSPPCASFSTSGKREAGWGAVKDYSDTKQRTDDLFFEYARLIREIQPKVFVAENVSGLVKGTAKGYFKLILQELKDSGYRVDARLLDAQWLGVPQQRQRLIFIGVRNDLSAQPVHPSPLPYRYSLREALPWIIKTHVGIGASERDRKRLSSLPAVTVMSEGYGGSPFHQYEVEAETDISRYAIGDEWDNVKPGCKSDKYMSLLKCDVNRPSFTITAESGNTGAAGPVHPTEKRKFSISELRRVGGFPDDFILTGTYAQQWERIGRAVPPVMMQHIAAAIRDKVLPLCQ
jgi:DNA (cytosine-5)-methyltransferase 1